MIVSQGLTVSAPLTSVTPSARNVLNTIATPGCVQVEGSRCAHAARAPPRSIIAAASSGIAHRAPDCRGLLALKLVIFSPPVCGSDTRALYPSERVPLLALDCQENGALLSRQLVDEVNLRADEREVSSGWIDYNVYALRCRDKARLRVERDSPALGILGCG